jgi:hypothetical protein
VRHICNAAVFQRLERQIREIEAQHQISSGNLGEMAGPKA